MIAKVIFPKELQCDYKSFKFLIFLDVFVKNVRNGEIYFDFKDTKLLNTCHLAILMYIVEGIVARKNCLMGNVGSDGVENLKVISKLYDQYSVENVQFIAPIKLSYRDYCANSDIWLENLKSMDLRDYNKIKILISELLANLKMHTVFQEGTMSGSIDRAKEILTVSIVNYDLTIRRNLESEHMDFLSDFDAIMWALKRTHTTRNVGASGGLGLYLLRKYVSELKAQCIIVSGNCFITLDEKCFDAADENRIEYKRCVEMPHYYGGNIFTLMLPLKVNTERKKLINDVRMNEINLRDIWIV